MKALSYGDTLQVLRDSVATESVDLIYLDPPFNSNATDTYNVRCWRVSRPQFRAAACPLLAAAITGHSRCRWREPSTASGAKIPNAGHQLDRCERYP